MTTKAMNTMVGAAMLLTATQATADDGGARTLKVSEGCVGPQETVDLYVKTEHPVTNNTEIKIQMSKARFANGEWAQPIKGDAEATQVTIKAGEQKSAKATFQPASSSVQLFFTDRNKPSPSTGKPTVTFAASSVADNCTPAE